MHFAWRYFRTNVYSNTYENTVINDVLCMVSFVLILSNNNNNVEYALSGTNFRSFSYTTLNTEYSLHSHHYYGDEEEEEKEWGKNTYPSQPWRFFVHTDFTLPLLLHKFVPVQFHQNHLVGCIIRCYYMLTLAFKLKEVNDFSPVLGVAFFHILFSWNKQRNCKIKRQFVCVTT